MIIIISPSDVWKANICGVWWNSKPNKSKNWVEFSSSNPEETLRSWGYKAPDRHIPGWVDSRLRNRAQQLGWTRPQTWQSWACGSRTYRDNAVPNMGVASNKRVTDKLKEQNYDRWSPRGEPNPEVWVSGPWPYAVWPAYVLWWHDTY